MDMTNKTLLILVSWFNPENISGSFFYEQAEILSNSGIRVIFVYPYIGKNTVAHTDINGIEFIPFRQVELACNKSNIIRILEAWINRRRLYKLFKDKLINEKISGVFAQNIQRAGFWAMWLHERFNLPYITFQHNQFKPDAEDYYRKNWRVGLVMKKSVNNFTVSNDMIRQFSQTGRYEKLQVLHNPVSLPRDISIERGKVRKDGEDNMVIGISGQYCNIKNQMLLFSSLKYLTLDRNIKIKIVWMGFDSWNRGVNTE
jgi:hypothetical protein